MSQTLLYPCKRFWIWLTRIRHRCGYGVHSPFAFYFITRVIYEKEAYYAYQDLPRLLKEKQQAGDNRADELKKIDRLLFRLVNYLSPSVMVDIGKPVSTGIYMQAACRKATYLSGETREEISLPEGETVDFLYLHLPTAESTANLFRSYLSCIAPGSMMVVRGIHRSSSMKHLWREMKEHEQVGITFDLYDVGILFFDRSRIKQHYLVNF